MCARFSKRKMDLPPGRVVQGTFTRDFKENALNCQILVTVPECLEILLLSPERSAWAKSLRWEGEGGYFNLGPSSTNRNKFEDKSCAMKEGSFQV